jgi:predicted metal-binding membrane protein
VWSCSGGIARATWPWPVQLATALTAWLVMIGAMMLPTIVPLVRMFIPATSCVSNARAVRVALLTGYLAVWSAFAVAATFGHRGLDALLGDRARPAGLMLGATLVVAGLFQLSPWKRACLRACRSPWGFLWQYYGLGVRGAWTLGVRHGLFCLGCCWALMLVMLGTGASSLLWMLALTAAMVVEKTAPDGARLAAPLGGALIVAGGVVSVPAIWAAPADLPASTSRATGDVLGGEVALVVTAIGLAVLWPMRAVARRRGLDQQDRDDPRGGRG